MIRVVLLFWVLAAFFGGLFWFLTKQDYRANRTIFLPFVKGLGIASFGIAMAIFAVALLVQFNNL